jgi:hypothetical protein
MGISGCHLLAVSLIAPVTALQAAGGALSPEQSYCSLLPK